MSRKWLIACTSILAAAGTLRAQAQAIPELKLSAHRDSFVVMMQGKPMGSSVVALEAIDSGRVRITESTEMGTTVQKTVVMLDAAAHMRSVVQTTKARGMDSMIAIDYSGGRVRGSAQIPGAQGIKSIAIDTIVPGNIIDDNALQALLPGLPWAAHASWQLPVFSAGKNATATYTLAVTGSEDVAVPAGSFRAYKSELRAGPQSIYFWIDTKSHRVVKVAPAGAPLEFVLAN